MARAIVKSFTNPKDNIIINGNFTFAQRNTGTVSIAASHSYISVDRWSLAYNSAWSVTPQAFLTSSLPTGSISTRALGIQGTPTAKNSSTNIQIRQRIESFMVRKIPVGEQATLSFWYVSDVNAGADAEINVVINNANALDNFTTTTGITSQTFNPTAPGSWNRKTITFTMPAGAHNGLQLLITRGNISTGGNRQFYLGDVMLHEGLLPMESFVLAGKNNIGELAICQRYYEKSYDLETAPGTNTSSGILIKATSGDSAGNHYINVDYKVSKRIPAHTTRIWNSTGVADQASVFANNSAQNSVVFSGNATCTVDATSSSGFYAHAFSYAAYGNGRIVAQWTADAEL